LNYRGIRRPVVETISNCKDLIAQRGSNEKCKTLSYSASSPKTGGKPVKTELMLAQNQNIKTP
jgi:hypothetical protein